MRLCQKIREIWIGLAFMMTVAYSFNIYQQPKLSKGFMDAQERIKAGKMGSEPTKRHLAGWATNISMTSFGGTVNDPHEYDGSTIFSGNEGYNLTTGLVDVSPSNGVAITYVIEFFAVPRPSTFQAIVCHNVKFINNPNVPICIFLKGNNVIVAFKDAIGQRKIDLPAADLFGWVVVQITVASTPEILAGMFYYNLHTLKPLDFVQYRGSVATTDYTIDFSQPATVGLHVKADMTKEFFFVGLFKQFYYFKTDPSVTVFNTTIDGCPSSTPCKQKPNRVAGIMFADITTEKYLGNDFTSELGQTVRTNQIVHYLTKNGASQHDPLIDMGTNKFKFGSTTQASFEFEFAFDAAFTDDATFLELKDTGGNVMMGLTYTKPDYSNANKNLHVQPQIGITFGACANTKITFPRQDSRKAAPYDQYESFIVDIIKIEEDKYMACLGSTFDITSWQCTDCAATGAQKFVKDAEYSLDFKKEAYFMRTINMYGFPLGQGYMISRYANAAKCENDKCHTCSFDNNYTCSIKMEMNDYFVPKYNIGVCPVNGNDQCYAAILDINKCLNQTFNAGTCDLTCTTGHELTVNATGKWCIETCGDGSLYHKYPNITCDDGNLVNGDGCNNNCRLEDLENGTNIWTCTEGNPTTATVCLKCGDGATNLPGEEFDDGNIIPGDGLDENCKIEVGWTCPTSGCVPICGDGRIRGTEVCDDQNTNSGDGCKSDCSAVEAKWACARPNVDTKDVCDGICGDGYRIGSESCDDKNLVNSDGCTSGCKVEPFFQCTGGSSVNKDTCLDICQDSVTYGIRLGNASYCDDGNGVNNDGCSSSCGTETGWTCSGGSNTAKSTCVPICANSAVHGSEPCDDGGTVAGDGCSPTCTIEAGWTCLGGTTTSPSSCSDICGDGKDMDPGSLATYCDDGNKANLDGCSSTCAEEKGWSCTQGTTTAASVCTPICQDGLVRGVEKCDDANAAVNDGCTATCTVEPGWTCTGEPSVCKDICGDGKNHNNSQASYCDDGNTANSDGCSSGCGEEVGYLCNNAGFATKDTCAPVCGDSRRVGIEACDVGNTLATAGCSATCTVIAGWTCSGGSVSSPDVCVDICGDGWNMNTTTTYCDDGGKVNGDGCDSTCGEELGYKCTGGTPTTKDTCAPVCADSRRVGTEGCDDGNSNNGDGCSSTCQVESGWACTGGTPTSKDTCSDVCGDGIDMQFTNTTKCDDGNKVSNDGCSATCLTELGYSCTGGSATKADTCTEVCQDGRKVGGEACDDSNGVNGDGCSSTCTVETGWSCSGGSSTSSSTCIDICQDGKNFNTSVAAYCDDGNGANSDGCTSTCQVETGWKCSGGSSTTPDTCIEWCGDQKQINSETCDDGNTAANDGCNSLCRVETGWSCVGGSPTSKSTCSDICTDGLNVYNTTKVGYCDDSNNKAGDGCSATCAVEAGWGCTGGTKTTQDTCIPICGDSKQIGTETCDDTNAVSNDGCSSTCQVEVGWKCLGGSPTSSSTCTDICQDGRNVNSTHAAYCDDGNSNTGDGCDASCQEETGFSCNGGSKTGPDTCLSTCGDSIMVGTEGCDDGNAASGEGCSSLCQVEIGWACTHVNKFSVCSEVCGDGRRFNTNSSYCDDQNNNSGDGCSATCVQELGFTCTGGTSSTKDICVSNCGDGVKSSIEACDDHNNVAGDGCTATCLVETGWDCSTILANQTSKCVEICGDGKRFNSNTTYCDNGGGGPTTGCDNSCNVVTGYECSGGTKFIPDTCNPKCGDGLKITGENCDDGNTASGDGCHSSCSLVEAGWSCTGGSPTSKDTCTEICGDGKRFNTKTSYCDDKNLVAGDGCDATCNTEDGFYCTGGTTTLKDSCNTKCGDNFRAGSEACDDGNTKTLDGCNNGCGVENGWQCTGGTPTSGDTCSIVCGDSKRVGTETCDDGNTSPTDGCSNVCQVETGWSCTGGTGFSKDTCTNICGDSMLVGSEKCDDGNNVAADGCSKDTCLVETGFKCSGMPSNCVEICGDGIKVGKEQCDDGNTTPNDGCDNICKVETGYSCSGGTPASSDKCSEVCADGLNVGGEDCDDGNTKNSDGCDSTCKTEPGYTCSGGSNTTKDSCSPICGDGKVMPLELCDDNNKANGDGCSGTCTVETGFLCTGGSTSSKSICDGICADGLRVSTEACDDGNNKDGDGCSRNTCLVEKGYTCAGLNPDVCQTICGDGYRIGDEKCDDGNTQDGDGCNSKCDTVEVGFNCVGGNSNSRDVCTEICGDGRRVGIEKCDDKNVDDGDGCAANCSKVELGWLCKGGSPTSRDYCRGSCGDGYKMPNEECDDKNLNGDDGCTTSCRIAPCFECSRATPTTPDVCTPIILNPTTYYGDIKSFSLFMTFDRPMAHKVKKSYLNLTLVKQYGCFFDHSIVIVNSTTIKVPLQARKVFMGDNIKRADLKFNPGCLYQPNNKARMLTDHAPIPILFEDQFANEKAIAAQAGASNAYAAAATLAFLVMSVIMKSVPSAFMWMFLNTVQLLYYVPLTTPNFPPHVKEFFIMLAFSAARFEFIENYILKFTTFDQNLNEEPYNAHFELYGFESTSFLKNTIQVFLTLVINYLWIPILITAILIFKLWKKHKMKEYFQDALNQYRWNNLLRMMLETYLDLTICSAMNVYKPNFDTLWEASSTYIAFFFLLVCALYPLFVLIFLSWRTIKIQQGHKPTHLSYSALFDGIKKKKWQQIHFQSLFLFRRLFLGFLLVAAAELPWLQVSFFGFWTFMATGYQLLVKPYEEMMENVVTAMNECCLSTVAVCMFLYVKELDQGIAMKGGWVIIGVVIFVNIINLIIAVIVFFISFVENCKKWFKVKKDTKVEDETNATNADMFKSNPKITGGEMFKPKSMKIRPAFANGKFSVDDIGRDDNSNAIEFEPYDSITPMKKLSAMVPIQEIKEEHELSPDLQPEYVNNDLTQGQVDLSPEKSNLTDMNPYASPGDMSSQNLVPQQDLPQPDQLDAPPSPPYDPVEPLMQPQAETPLPATPLPPPPVQEVPQQLPSTPIQPPAQVPPTPQPIQVTPTPVQTTPFTPPPPLDHTPTTPVPAPAPAPAPIGFVNAAPVAEPEPSFGFANMDTKFNQTGPIDKTGKMASEEPTMGSTQTGKFNKAKPQQDNLFLNM